MKKYFKFLSTMMVIAVASSIFSGCRTKSSGGSSSEISGTDDTSVSSSSGDANILHIGDVGDVEFTTSGNQIIYSYGRIKLALEQSDFDAFGLTSASKNALSNTENATSVISKKDENTISLEHSWANASSSLNTKLHSNDDGSMSIIQNAVVSSGGISALRFGFEISKDYNVILPTSNGVELSTENPKLWNGKTRIAYPDEWEMQMFLIQGDNGGLLVYAKDNATQFKALNLNNDDSNFDISVETIPQAPFTNYSQFETIEWRLVPYKGDWTNGSAIYKEFANSEFGLSEISRPDWVKNVEVAVLSDLDDLSMLDKLAKEVNPSQTLIHYPAWRLEHYDVNYPDYTPAVKAKEIIDYAHKLGFKVQLHINMNACQDDSAPYSKMKDSASLDPYTLNPIYFECSDALRSYRFIQMNPASAQWRKYMINTLVEAIKYTGADALHLDQSLLCYNDGHGLVDGMTSMQGNILYHKELAAALPNVAIGSEGVTDINARYTSFAQSNAYGIDWASQTYSQNMIDQIVPVTMSIYDSYLSVYQWPGLPTTLNEDYWQAWYRACNMRCGFMPTIMRCSAKEISSPNETMKLFLREAKWFQQNHPQSIYKDWSENTFMKWTLKNGKTAEYKKDSSGEVLIPDIEKPSTELTRFVTGVTNAKLEGTIANWYYYNNDYIYGLNPDKSYLYLYEKRSADAIHIFSMNDNITVQSFDKKSAYTAVSLGKVVDDSKVVTDFMNYDGMMRSGEVLYDSTEEPSVKENFNSKSPFYYAFPHLAIFRHMGDRFLMHPPWKSEDTNIGYVYSEYDTQIGTYGNATFSASVQMASAANAAISDGVTYKFFIWKAGDNSRSDMITKEIHVTTATPIPIALDIARFQGKKVTIRVEAHPGKTTANDSSVIVEPKVVQVKSKDDTPVTYKIKAASAVSKIISSNGKTSYKSLGDNTYEISTYLSEMVYLLYGKGSVSIPLNMCYADFTSSWVYNSGSIGTPTKELLPRMQIAEVNDELTQGIFAHPPTDGKCYISFVVTLPLSPSVNFKGTVGLKSGSSASDGVKFSVTVDGKQLWSQNVSAGSSLKNFSIPMSAYAGKTVLLTLITDSGDNSAFDYAFWGTPTLSK